MTTRRSRSSLTGTAEATLREKIGRSSSIKKIKRLSIRDGYVVATVLVKGDDMGCADFTMSTAYTLDGQYIGDPKTARMLVQRFGIAPELRKRTNTVCSIGFSRTRKKWYGWSHRAIFGFKVGSRVKRGDVICSKAFPVGFVATTMNDAKAMAKKFADAVS